MQEEHGRTAVGKLSRGLKGMLGSRKEEPLASSAPPADGAPKQKSLAGLKARFLSKEASHGSRQTSPGTNSRAYCTPFARLYMMQAAAHGAHLVACIPFSRM